MLETLGLEATGGIALAHAAVHHYHYRGLRDPGITVRGGIDVLIASFCIEHRGLRRWRQ